MAVRGVYTAEEEKMLAGWRKIQEAEVGWVGEELTRETPYPVLNRVATKDLILNNANGIGDLNPLWRDENYATNTRWGGIIAPPFYPYVISPTGALVSFKVPPSIGSKGHGPFGPRWEFCKPIHEGDSFRVRSGVNNSIEDTTSLDGMGPRSFLITSGRKFINQKDEVVCINYIRELKVILPPGKEKEKHPVEPKPKITAYRYTKEELEFIDLMYDEEEIRGASPRYWEDVSVGDELKPIVIGPVTVWDQILEYAGRGILVSDVREARKKGLQSLLVVDPVTSVTHLKKEVHLIDYTAQLLGHPLATIGKEYTEEVLCRVVTNWMGDDGFLKVFESLQDYTIPIGDAFFCRGVVIKKQVENGEHLVDIKIWAETIRGYVVRWGMATVSLFSRQEV